MNQAHARYGAYKDSGVDSLGEVPKHWSLLRLKEILSIASGDGANLIDIDFRPGLYPIYGGNGVMGYTDYYNNSKDILVIGRVGAKCGNVHYVNEKVWVSDNALVAKSNFNKFFLEYALNSLNLNKLSSANAQPLITGSLVKNQFIALPDKSEATRITNYLDTQTAQLDRKIGLLGQKAAQYGKLKQSLINETVTRGLDKTVAMKDSGVEWIGEVPAHWDVTAITNITNTVSIKNHPKEELLSVYRDYGVIIKSTRDDNHNKAGADLSNYKLVEPGYLVINKMKAWQGSLGVSEFRGIVSPAYITCRTNRKIVERSYLHHLLRCRNYINEYNRLSFGVRVDQWDMRYDDFKYVPVLLPPMKEQTAIANYLDEKTAHIDRIVDSINTQIYKLKELRKTLINDVVTGKIKVA